jgi:hypothetical protein
MSFAYIMTASSPTVTTVGSSLSNSKCGNKNATMLCAKQERCQEPTWPLHRRSLLRPIPLTCRVSLLLTKNPPTLQLPLLHLPHFDDDILPMNISVSNTDRNKSNKTDPTLVMVHRPSRIGAMNAKNELSKTGVSTSSRTPPTTY